MRLFLNTNYTLSRAAGENMYLNDYDPEHNDYVPNVIYTDMFDRRATTKVLSVGNKRHNAYVAYINNGAQLTAKAKREVPQDHATTGRVVFFAVFKNVPFECEIGGAMYSPIVDDANLDEIVKGIRLTRERYPNAEIVIGSSIGRYATVCGAEEDPLRARLAALLGEDGKMSYDLQYDVSTLSAEGVFAVATNRESMLFAFCHERNVPVILTSKCDEEMEPICDRYVGCAYHNSVDDAVLKVYERPAEFHIVPVEYASDLPSAPYMAKYRANTRYLSNAFARTPGVLPGKTKLHLYNDAMLLYPLFDTEANRASATLTPEIEGEGTVVVTMNKFDEFHRARRANRSAPLNWLGFDFDCVHQCAKDATFVRFYASCYENRVPVYDFDNEAQLAQTFGLGEIKPIAIAPTGRIVVFMDNPFGMNYADADAWGAAWAGCFARLRAAFPSNAVVVRPYPHETEGMRREYDARFDAALRDETLVGADICEYLSASTDVCFCFKRQGADFLKTFVSGKLMLSGLSAEELAAKPDAKSISRYEHTLDGVLAMSGDGITNLQQIATTYNTDRLEHLKNMTANFVAIEDLRNGHFLSKILS